MLADIFSFFVLFFSFCSDCFSISKPVCLRKPEDSQTAIQMFSDKTGCSGRQGIEGFYKDSNDL